MNPRALTLVPWVPMRIILTVRSPISHFAGPHRQTSKATGWNSPRLRWISGYYDLQIRVQRIQFPFTLRLQLHFLSTNLRKWRQNEAYRLPSRCPRTRPWERILNGVSPSKMSFGAELHKRWLEKTAHRTSESMLCHWNHAPKGWTYQIGRSWRNMLNEMITQLPHKSQLLISRCHICKTFLWWDWKVRTPYVYLRKTNNGTCQASTIQDREGRLTQWTHIWSPICSYHNIMEPSFKARSRNAFRTCCSEL